MRRSRLKRHLSMLVGAALAAVPLAVVATGSPPAAAQVGDTQPREAALSGEPTTMWQTNNNVEALAVSRGIVFAGGTFTRVRPPGAAAGTNEVAQPYLAAFNASTGALLTNFTLQPNARVEDLAVSPDGSRLYVVGGFTRISGSVRNRVAAVTIPATPTGSFSLVSGFNPNVSGGVVTAVDASSTAVYFSGNFTTVGTTAKAYIASVSATNGSLNTGFTTTLAAPAPSLFTPSPSPGALALEVAPDGSRVLIGGGFNTVNGQVIGGMASLNPTTGQLETWLANRTQPTNTNCSGRITDIVVDGDTAYVTGEGDPPGCYEGTYAARISDGELKWNSTCLGASLGLAVLDGVLYKGSHQHDCAFNPGDAHGGYVGGTSRDTFVWYRLVAQDVRDGSFQHWSPNTNAITGSNPAGPQVMATDGQQIFVGGDFTRVNNVAQQGIVRFGRTGNSTPNRPDAPAVRSTAAGQATITWPAVYDPDDGWLTYRLYRGNTMIYETTVESFPWSRPMMRFDDTGRAAGSTVRYYLRVTDGTATSAASASTEVVIRSTDPADYRTQVGSLSPTFHWDMSGNGTTVADVSGNGADGLVVGGATRGRGAIGAEGMDLDGSSGYLVSQQNLALSPSFTQSLWVRGTTIAGGSLMAVTDAQTGDGTISDRALTMDNNGNIVFSVHRPPRTGSPDPLGPGLNNVRLQGPIYNDGGWHHVVATWSDADGTDTDTARLYIDGVLNGEYVGTAGGLTQGYYRVGYTDLAREQAVFGRNFYNQTWPGSEHFNGSVDEVAVFPRALTPEEVVELFAAGVHDGPATPAPVPPTAALSTTVDQARLTADASGSADPDGRIVSYAWDFGDGGTATTTTAQASHDYAASGGYTVTVTVTDDAGLTATATSQVTVDAGTPPAEVDTVVVANNSSWRWRYEPGAPPAGWNGRAFDDTSWAAGNAVLGFGTQVATSLDKPTTAERPLAAYFRRSFEVARAADVVRLRLTGIANDGVVLYVNGTEVARSNMPAGAVSSTTYASSARSAATANATPLVVDVPARLLVDGVNVISAETHLNYRATRDMAFDLQAVLTELR